MSLGRKQVKGPSSIVAIRGRRLSDLKPKRMAYDQFQRALTSVTVTELNLLLTLRSNGVTNDEFVFLGHVLDDPKTLDAVFEMLLHGLEIPATELTLEQAATVTNR